MSSRQPTNADRYIAHILVGAGAGLIVGKKTGTLGFVIAALLAATAQELFDAPIAHVVADLIG